MVLELTHDLGQQGLAFVGQQMLILTEIIWVVPSGEAHSRYCCANRAARGRVQRHIELQGILALRA